MKKLKAAVIQLNSGSDKAKNLENASRLITKAAYRGAQLVALPELFNWRGSKQEVKLNSESIPGPTLKRMAELASSLKLFLLCGSIIETNARSSKPYNTSFLLDPHGKCIASYRKLHLFKAQLKGGGNIDEHQSYSTGGEVKTFTTSVGKVGLTICYDLRFPELYRALAHDGAVVIFVPSAFTFETGKAHWEILLRARAIENQVYLIAPNQYGTDPLGNHAYGHSMIVDPWGTIIAQGSEGEGIIYGELDLEYLHRVREQLPSLKHLREDLFTTKANRLKKKS